MTGAPQRDLGLLLSPRLCSERGRACWDSTPICGEGAGFPDTIICVAIWMLSWFESVTVLVHRACLWRFISYHNNKLCKPSSVTHAIEIRAWIITGEGPVQAKCWGQANYEMLLLTRQQLPPSHFHAVTYRRGPWRWSCCRIGPLHCNDMKRRRGYAACSSSSPPAPLHKPSESPTPSLLINTSATK